MLKKQKIILIVVVAFGITFVAMHSAIAAEDRSNMDHSQMNHAAPAPASAANMQGMDHAGDGNKMPMSMQGGAAPADARDPHAYSGGYDFGPIPPPQMADVAYMGVLRVNRLERVRSNENIHSNYDIQGMFGRDYDQLIFMAEGEVADGKLQEARTELLWGHALATFWNAHLGLRHDSGTMPDQQWLTAGVQGLAPYWFEVNATAYVGKHGRSAIRLDAEYDLLLTQKLILQPRLEANLYGKQDELRALGSGLSDLVAGMRLRYEIRREFAFYIGVERHEKFGRTAEYARAAGLHTHENRAVVGVRFWY